MTRKINKKNYGYRHPQEVIERGRGHILSSFSLESGRKSKSKETQDAEYRQSVLDAMSKKNKEDAGYGRNVIASVALASPWARDRADRLRDYFPNFRNDKNLKGQVATKDDAGETYRFSTYNPLSGKTRGSSTMKRNTKTGRVKKNQYGYRHPQEEIERARATAYRAPSRISPAQVAAMAQAKTPLQLGLTTLGRRADRAYKPIDRAGNATAGLLGNIGGLVAEPAKQGLRAYFQNANDQGELKSIMPVLGAMGQGFMQSAKKLPASTKEFGSAMAGAYEPTKDLLGAMAELGYSNVLYPAGKAINQFGRDVSGQMYRNSRDMLMPYLNEGNTRGGSSTLKRATMCKCGSGMSKSMCKCGAKGKTTKKRALRKADYFINNAPSPEPSELDWLVNRAPAYTINQSRNAQYTPSEQQNDESTQMSPSKSRGKKPYRPNLPMKPLPWRVGDKATRRTGDFKYPYPFLPGTSGARKRPRPVPPIPMPVIPEDSYRHPQEEIERARAQQRAFGGSSGIANSSMVKRSLRKRQAGPKPHKYF